MKNNTSIYNYILTRKALQNDEFVDRYGTKHKLYSNFGEDNDYIINAPSFTNNGNGTITDTVTGLMWQQADMRNDD
jgi:hypothetical protein